MTPNDGIAALADKYNKDSDRLLLVFRDAIHRRQLEPQEAGTLTGFLICATAAQKHLKRGFQERDIVYISWATRTLLELLVWTQYCIRSKENAQRFYQDSVRDLAGAMGAYRDLVSDTTRYSDEQRSLIYDTEAKTMKLAASLGVVPLDVSFLPVNVAADEVGLGVDYQKANKVLSKLVHPTAYMVCTSIMDGLAGGASVNFFMAGVDYALRVYAVLNGFAARLEPKDTDVQSKQ